MFGFNIDDQPSAYCPTCHHPYYRSDVGKACNICDSRIILNKDKFDEEEEDADICEVCGEESHDCECTDEELDEGRTIW